MVQRGGLGDCRALNLPFPDIPQAEPALYLGAWLSFRYTAQKGMGSFPYPFSFSLIMRSLQRLRLEW